MKTDQIISANGILLNIECDNGTMHRKVLEKLLWEKSKAIENEANLKRRGFKYLIQKLIHSHVKLNDKLVENENTVRVATVNLDNEEFRNKKQSSSFDNPVSVIVENYLDNAIDSVSLYNLEIIGDHLIDLNIKTCSSEEKLSLNDCDCETKSNSKNSFCTIHNFYKEYEYDLVSRNHTDEEKCTEVQLNLGDKNNQTDNATILIDEDFEGTPRTNIVETVSHIQTCLDRKYSLDIESSNKYSSAAIDRLKSCLTHSETKLGKQNKNCYYNIYKIHIFKSIYIFFSSFGSRELVFRNYIFPETESTFS